MTDVTEQQERKSDHLNEENISSLIEQINEQLDGLRQDDLQLTEQLKSLYDGLCHLRQSLTNPQLNSNTDIVNLPIEGGSLSPNYNLPKPRSDSVPNILTDRYRLLTIIDDIN